MFTDGEIDIILNKTRSALDHCKIPAKWRNNFSLSLRSYLQDDSLQEDVCPTCLGNGRKIRNERTTNAKTNL